MVTWTAAMFGLERMEARAAQHSSRSAGLDSRINSNARLRLTRLVVPRQEVCVWIFAHLSKRTIILGKAMATKAADVATTAEATTKAAAREVDGGRTTATLTIP